MADIELAIKIPEETYIYLRDGGNIGASLLIENAIKNGTPLSKGHGRLIDASKLKVELECGIRAGNYEEGYENIHILTQWMIV